MLKKKDIPFSQFADKFCSSSRAAAEGRSLWSSLSKIRVQFRQPRSQQASKCSAVTNGPLARMCALPNAILISRLSSTYYRCPLMGGMFKISLRGSTPPRSCILSPSRAPSTRCDDARGDASAFRSYIKERDTV